MWKSWAKPWLHPLSWFVHLASIVTHIKVNTPHDPVYILIGIQSSTAQPLPVTALHWVPERVPRQAQSAIPTILITQFSLSSHLQYLSHCVNATNFSISYSPLTILKNVSATANFHDGSLFEWLSYSISSLLVALFSKAMLNYLCALQFTSSFSSLQRASEVSWKELWYPQIHMLDSWPTV